MMTAKHLLGIRIKGLRETKDWTQENLAERMDISPNYLSSIERGKENPTLDMLIKFSKGLKVEMWELFDFAHEEMNSKELRKSFNNFAKEVDEVKLRLAVKLLRALVR